MSTIQTTVECPIHDSFRVRQVAGMFDVPITEKARAHFEVEVPTIDDDWQIGLIVGPSGSGKSTIARKAFGDAVVTDFTWPRDKAVVDCFGDLPIKQITGLLTAVGFSSPPSWIKPYAVLSGGEKFRCDLARALSSGQWPVVSDQLKQGATAGLSSSESGSLVSSRRITGDAQSLLHPEGTRPAVAHGPLVVFDEFTSVVDRNVACIGSAAIAKAIRPRLPPATDHLPLVRCRFVAVSCHYDIAEWLEPDWIVDMATSTCQWRRLRRPEIELRLHRASVADWPLFARHHYLSGMLNRSARCYLAYWNDEPVTFCATLPVQGRKRHYRISRIVTLPDYQGIGVGMRVAEAVAELHRAEGLRFSVTASHPALIAHCVKSSLWRTTNVMKTGTRSSAGRAIVSFEYRRVLPCERQSASRR